MGQTKPDGQFGETRMLLDADLARLYRKHFGDASFAQPAEAPAPDSRSPVGESSWPPPMTHQITEGR